MDDKLFKLMVLDQLVEADGEADAPYWDTRWRETLASMQSDGLVSLGMRIQRFFKDRSRDGMYIRVWLTEAGRQMSAEGKV